MLAKAFVDNAKVMAKGQVTIPKDVRDVLGVASGDRVTFVVEGNTVRIVNSAVYAMQMLQQEMAGEAERTGLTSEEDVMALVKNCGTRMKRHESFDRYQRPYFCCVKRRRDPVSSVCKSGIISQSWLDL